MSGSDVIGSGVNLFVCVYYMGFDAFGWFLWVGGGGGGGGKGGFQTRTR